MLCFFRFSNQFQRKGSMYGATSLIIASHKGYTDIAHILIAAGADLNAKSTVLLSSFSIFTMTPLKRCHREAGLH